MVVQTQGCNYRKDTSQEHRLQYQKSRKARGTPNNGMPLSYKRNEADRARVIGNNLRFTQNQMSRIAYVIYEKDKAGWVNILTHTRAALLTLGAAVAASPGNSRKCKSL